MKAESLFFSPCNYFLSNDNNAYCIPFRKYRKDKKENKNYL